MSVGEWQSTVRLGRILLQRTLLVGQAQAQPRVLAEELETVAINPMADERWPEKGTKGEATMSLCKRGNWYWADFSVDGPVISNRFMLLIGAKLCGSKRRKLPTRNGGGSRRSH
jgi:hypothetical protein